MRIRKTDSRSQLLNRTERRRNCLAAADGQRPPGSSTLLTCD
jgi:hypothetical protein